MKMVILMIMIILTKEPLPPTPDAWCWDIKQVYSPTSYCTKSHAAVFGRVVLPLRFVNKMMYRVFLLMWPAATQIYWINRKCLQEKRGSIPTVSLFWDTNMAVMMSFENALLTFMQYFLGFLCVNYLSYLLKLSNKNYLHQTSYEVPWLMKFFLWSAKCHDWWNYWPGYCSYETPNSVRLRSS